MAHPVVHWEIGGHHLPALREFYGKAFGWTFSDADPTYSMVDAVDGGFGGGLMQIPAQAPPHVTVYVQVEDLDGTLAEIAALGATTLVKPTAINANASFAMFSDPEGNVIGLLKVSDPATT